MTFQHIGIWNVSHHELYTESLFAMFMLVCNKSMILRMMLMHERSASAGAGTAGKAMRASLLGKTLCRVTKCPSLPALVTLVASAYLLFPVTAVTRQACITFLEQRTGQQLPWD